MWVRKLKGHIFTAACAFSTLIIIAVLFTIIGTIFILGLPSLSWYFLTTPENATPGLGQGIANAVIGTLLISVLATFGATPLGIGTAVYLQRYAKKSRATETFRFLIEVLSGTPSIVLGIFGLLTLVYIMKAWTGGFSLISGTIALSILIIPVICRSAENAIELVPRDLEEGSYALGATKWHTVRNITLPVALSGISTGVILAFGRAAEESAVVILTAGYSQFIPELAVKNNDKLAMGIKIYPFQDLVGTLPYSVYHAYINSNVVPMSAGFAAAFILIIIVFLINLSAKGIQYIGTGGLRRPLPILGSFRRNPKPPGPVPPGAKTTTLPLPVRPVNASTHDGEVRTIQPKSPESPLSSIKPDGLPTVNQTRPPAGLSSVNPVPPEQTGWRKALAPEANIASFPEQNNLEEVPLMNEKTEPDPPHTATEPGWLRALREPVFPVPVDAGTETSPSPAEPENTIKITTGQELASAATPVSSDPGWLRVLHEPIILGSQASVVDGRQDKLNGQTVISGTSLSGADSVSSQPESAVEPSPRGSAPPGLSQFSPIPEDAIPSRTGSPGVPSEPLQSIDIAPGGSELRAEPDADLFEPEPAEDAPDDESFPGDIMETAPDIPGKVPGPDIPDDTTEDYHDQPEKTLPPMNEPPQEPPRTKESPQERTMPRQSSEKIPYDRNTMTVPSDPTKHPARSLPGTPPDPDLLDDPGDDLTEAFLPAPGPKGMKPAQSLQPPVSGRKPRDAPIHPDMDDYLDLLFDNEPMPPSMVRDAETQKADLTLTPLRSPGGEKSLAAPVSPRAADKATNKPSSPSAPAKNTPPANGNDQKKSGLFSRFSRKKPKDAVPIEQPVPSNGTKPGRSFPLAGLFRKKAHTEMASVHFDPGRIAEPSLEGALKDVDITYPVDPPYQFVHIEYDHDEGVLQYEVREPVLSPDEEASLKIIEQGFEKMISTNLDLIVGGNREEYLKDRFLALSHIFGIKATDEQTERMFFHLKRQYLGYSHMDTLMKDKYIEDISCNGSEMYFYVMHRIYGSIQTNVKFGEVELNNFVLRLAQIGGRHISLLQPIRDVTLPDGSRANITLGGEVTRKGSTFTIRKFRSSPISPIEMMEYGTIDAQQLAFLWLLMEYKRSILVSGGTATGKTTMLNVLCSFIPSEYKIVSIEDTAELNLMHPNWIQSVTRTGFGGATGNTSSEGMGGSRKSPGDIALYDLLVASLRQRPEFIIVGEVRGDEAFTLFQAIAVGHAALGTIHAGSMNELLARIESNPMNVPRALFSNLDAVIFPMHIKKGERSMRRVANVTEILELDRDTGDLITNTAFKWSPDEDVFAFQGRTFLFDRIRDIFGISKDLLRTELADRSEFLIRLQQNGIKDYLEVSRIIQLYYRDKDAVLGRLRGNEGLSDLLDEQAPGFTVPYHHGGPELAEADAILADENDPDLILD